VPHVKVTKLIVLFAYQIIIQPYNDNVHFVLYFINVKVVYNLPSIALNAILATILIHKEFAQHVIYKTAKRVFKHQKHVLNVLIIHTLKELSAFYAQLFLAVA